MPSATVLPSPGFYSPSNMPSSVGHNVAAFTGSSQIAQAVHKQTKARNPEAERDRQATRRKFTEMLNRRAIKARDNEMKLEQPKKIPRTATINCNSYGANEASLRGNSGV